MNIKTKIVVLILLALAAVGLAGIVWFIQNQLMIKDVALSIYYLVIR